MEAIFLFCFKNIIKAFQSSSLLLGKKLKIPQDLRRCRREFKAGVKYHDKHRRFKPLLPKIMRNVRSFCNRVDELSVLVSSQGEYKGCSLLCFTETRLNGNIPDSSLELASFSLVLVDRVTQSSKRRGSGLAVLVNSWWCNPGHVTVKDCICTPNIDLLVV